MQSLYELNHMRQEELWREAACERLSRAAQQDTPVRWQMSPLTATDAGWLTQLAGRPARRVSRTQVA